MSFILDALKKSELERQRQTIPGLMDAGPLERRRRFPIWAVALVVLLGVNLAVLLFVLLRGSPSVDACNPGIGPGAPRGIRSRAVICPSVAPRRTGAACVPGRGNASSRRIGSGCTA